MEGRVPPPGADPTEDPSIVHHIPQPPQPKYFPKASGHETYIVQIPRDQVYRVPPPENARIVENYQGSNAKTKQLGIGRRWCLWVLLALIIIGAIIGAAVAIHLVFFNPKPPQFTIDKVHVKHAPTSKNKDASSPPAKYLVTLKAVNPNGKTSIAYGDGQTSLLHNSKEIADGTFPSSSQGAKALLDVEVVLQGNKKSTVENSKKPVNLSLTIDVPIVMKNVMKSWGKTMKVTCDFKVSDLTSHSKVESQDCSTKF
ncbi:hypothetical protein NMG60_11007309 [Bertholletia excelsa]